MLKWKLCIFFFFLCVCWEGGSDVDMMNILMNLFCKVSRVLDFVLS